MTCKIDTFISLMWILFATIKRAIRVYLVKIFLPRMFSSLGHASSTYGFISRALNTPCV